MNRYAQTKAFLDAERKYMEPPEDPTDTQEFEDKKLAMWDERIIDEGYMIEAIDEALNDVLKKLSLLIRDNKAGTHTLTIGSIVTKLVVDYCEPSDDDVLDELNGE